MPLQVRLPCSGGTAAAASGEIIGSVDMSAAGGAGDAAVWLGISITPATTTVPQLLNSDAIFTVSSSQVWLASFCGVRSFQTRCD